MFVRSLLVLLAFLAATISAAPVPKSLKKLSKLDIARFSLHSGEVTFEQILNEFASETGLELVGPMPDLGKVRLKMLPRTYTVTEYIDVLNERLEFDKLVLVRHAGTFYVQPADWSIDIARVDTVPIADVVPPKLPPVEREGWVWARGEMVLTTVREPAKLPPPKWGKTELVTCNLPLPKGLAYAVIKPQIAKSLSKFGSIDLNATENAIRVTDRADNVRFIHSLMNETQKSNCRW